jgi:PAS domain S-box-containing protein
MYPGNGGFYEKLGEIRAIESMRVPVAQEKYAALMLTGSASSGLLAIVVLFFFNTGLRQRVSEKTRSLEAEILEKEKVQEQLRESEEKFRTLFEKSADAIFIASDKGDILDANEEACKRYKYTREQLLSMKVPDIDAPKSAERAYENMSRIVRNGVSIFEVEHKTSDGVIIPNEVNARSFTRGDKTFVIATCRNIAERKRAESELAEEKERLAVTLRSIGDGVIATDVDGTITLLNKVAEELTGWTNEEAIGRPLAEVFNIVNETTREKCENPVEKVLKTGLVVGLANHTALIKKDGSEIILADSAAPIRDKDSKTVGIVLVFRDVTVQYRMEQEMQKLEKVETLGLLAGGLAHDFNNLLTSVMGNVSLVKMQVGTEHRSFIRLTEVEQATRRAADLTQQLLTFAKGGAPVKKIASIAEIAKESCNFALSGSHSRCIYNIPNSLWSTEVDRGQMNQVFNNLIINAVQAMPRGGAIRISFENATVQENEVPSLRAGDYIKIQINDEGTGIPKEIISKIFAPYFTTKQSGNGLGLATVLSIVKRHEGHVLVDSTEGKGTTFILYVPACKDTFSTEQVGTMGVQTGHGRILIMDDEPLVRGVASAILKELGYEVGEAKDGKEAIEIYKKAGKDGKPFSVVIMDLTIPGGMGGLEAVRKLLEIDPNAKAIVSSGYSMDPIMAEYKKFGFCGMVVKPYNANEVSEVISRVMGG